MPRASKARVFRSLQTSPNAGTVRDLATTFGTAANVTTAAAFTTAGTVTSIRWSPLASASAATAIPSAGAASSGMGWRDTVGENTAEQVRYDAGTWTLRVQLTKSGQGALPTDVTVRVTLIVYRVTSAGAFGAEVGRVQMADTVLSTTTLTLTGSFTTGTTLLFNASDKIQVEAYVQPIVATLPAAPATAVNVNFVVEDTSANSGGSFTAIPGYQIFYARALSGTGAGTAAFSRRIVLSKSFAVTGASTVARANRLGLFRSFTTTGAGTVAMTKRLQALRTLPATGSGSGAMSKRVAYLRAYAASGTGTGVLLKSLVLRRAFTVTGAGTVARITRLALARNLTVTGTGTTTLARQLGFARAFAVTGAGTVVLVRTLALARMFTTTGAGTVAATKVLAVARFLSVTGSGTTAIGKVLTFDRRFQVISSSLTRMRIEMSQTVLNRITGSGGGVTIIRKIFAVFDD